MTASVSEMRAEAAEIGRRHPDVADRRHETDRRATVGSSPPHAGLLHRVANLITTEDLPAVKVQIDRGQVEIDATGCELVLNVVQRWATALGLFVVEVPSEVNGFAATMWEASGYDGTSVWWRVHGTELLPTPMVDRFGVGLPS